MIDLRVLDTGTKNGPDHGWLLAVDVPGELTERTRMFGGYVRAQDEPLVEAALVLGMALARVEQALRANIDLQEPLF